MSRDLNRLGSVFRAHDEKHFTLPAAVLEARSTYGRLVSAVSPCEPVDLGRVDTALVEGLLAEAAKDAPVWPDPSDVIKARRASAAAEAWQAAHSMAVEQSEAQLVGAVVGRADQIIRECLAPAVEECLQAARKAAPDFAPVADFDDKQLLAAEAKHRNAALALDRIAARYSALRDVQARLTAGLQNDLDGIYAEVANLQELYGPQWPGRSRSAWSPFPPSARARMAMLVRETEPVPAVVMWTAAQRDSAWTAEFGPGRPGGMGAATPGSVDLIGADNTPIQPAHYNQLRPAGL